MGGGHEPILVEEVLRYLDPRPGERVLDGTVGAGGHARSIIPRIAPGGHYVALDRDPAALDLARRNLQNFEGTRFYHASFGDLRDLIARERLLPFDGALFDLGVSSMQIDDPARGFSFRQEGPLDMRMDPEGGFTASDLVNRLPERELADLIFRFGEERMSRRIARSLVEHRRRHGPVRTTSELADIVRRVVRRGSIDPATRTFQALRIAVNEELEALSRLLTFLPDLLAPGGRAIIIAFHSLEDRLVKQSFRDEARQGRLEVLTRKPVRPGEEETRRNPRARSARLRAARRPAATEPIRAREA